MGRASSKRPTMDARQKDYLVDVISTLDEVTKKFACCLSDDNVSNSGETIAPPIRSILLFVAFLPTIAIIAVGFSFFGFGFVFGSGSAYIFRDAARWEGGRVLGAPNPTALMLGTILNCCPGHNSIFRYLLLVLRLGSACRVALCHTLRLFVSL